MLFFKCYCSIIQYEVENADTSSSTFIIHDYFSYPFSVVALFGVFVFPDKAENSPSNFYEELCWNDWDCICL